MSNQVTVSLYTIFWIMQMKLGRKKRHDYKYQNDQNDTSSLRASAAQRLTVPSVAVKTKKSS